MQNEELKVVSIPVETEDSLRSKGWRPKGLTRTTSTDLGPVERTDNLIAQALGSGRSMDEIEKLIQLRNAEIERVAHLEFKAALSRFQELVPRITRDRKVSFEHKKDPTRTTDYEYSTLGHIKRTITKALAECGLSYEWKTRYQDGKIFVKTILSHIGGHSESDELMGFADESGGKAGIQAMKSTISYLRRGGLESVLGLVNEEEDDDGRAAAKGAAAPVRIVPGTTEFNQVLKAYIEGKTTMFELNDKYQFTEDQLQSLKANETDI